LKNFLFGLLVAATASPALGGGDPVRGQQLFGSRCIACHALDSNRVGPALRGVFGRRAGSAPGYSYSKAVDEAVLVWDDTNLERWLSGPEALIPGQKMGYSVGDAGDRADLIAYLKSVGVTAGQSADADAQ